MTAEQHTSSTAQGQPALPANAPAVRISTRNSGVRIPVWARARFDDEDVLQEALLRSLVRCRSNDRREDALAEDARRTAPGILRNMLKASCAKRRDLRREVTAEDRAAHVAGRLPTPQEQAAARDVLDRLPQSLRPLIMDLARGFSYRDLAQRYSVSLATVGNRVREARALLETR